MTVQPKTSIALRLLVSVLGLVAVLVYFGVTPFELTMGLTGILICVILMLAKQHGKLTRLAPWQSMLILAALVLVPALIVWIVASVVP